MRNRFLPKIEAGCRPFLPEGAKVIDGFLGFASGLERWPNGYHTGSLGDKRMVVGTEDTVYMFRVGSFRPFKVKELLHSWPLGRVPFGIYVPELDGPVDIRMAAIEMGHVKLVVGPNFRRALADFLARHDAAVSDPDPPTAPVPPGTPVRP